MQFIQQHYAWLIAAVLTLLGIGANLANFFATKRRAERGLSAIVRTNTQLCNHKKSCARQDYSAL